MTHTHPDHSPAAARLAAVTGAELLGMPAPEGEHQEAISQREAMADFAELVGTRGTAITQLTPSGKARIEGELIDVVSDGDLIPLGADVEVVSAQGNRVVVRSV